MKLFTLNPTPGHWVLWILLAAITLLGVGVVARTIYGWTVEYRNLRRYEDGLRQYRERNRLAPPRPRPSKDKDAMAGEFRERGLL